jgi:hypothetical protein
MAIIRNIDKAFEIELQKPKSENKLTKAQIFRNHCPFIYGIGEEPNIEESENIEEFCRKNHRDCFKDCWDVEFCDKCLFKEV